MYWQEKTVKITINRKTYSRTTDMNGYALLKIQIIYAKDKVKKL